MHGFQLNMTGTIPSRSGYKLQQITLVMASPSTDRALFSDNKKPDIIAGNVVVALLAVIAVILRFLSRRLRGQELKFDDWTILLALV